MTLANDPQIQKWNRDKSQSIQNAWEDYLAIEPTKHSHAHLQMMDFVVTQTQWSDELSGWMTADAYTPIITATPRWFSELPADVQSIKLEEGDAWASILEGKALSKSKGAAPREIGRVGLRVFAGVAVAAAVL